jgi:hypothetical protein
MPGTTLLLRVCVGWNSPDDWVYPLRPRLTYLEHCGKCATTNSRRTIRKDRAAELAEI